MTIECGHNVSKEQGGGGAGGRGEEEEQSALLLNRPCQKHVGRGAAPPTSSFGKVLVHVQVVFLLLSWIHHQEFSIGIKGWNCCWDEQ